MINGVICLDILLETRPSSWPTPCISLLDLNGFIRLCKRLHLLCKFIVDNLKAIIIFWSWRSQCCETFYCPLLCSWQRNHVIYLESYFQRALFFMSDQCHSCCLVVALTNTQCRVCVTYVQYTSQESNMPNCLYHLAIVSK